MFKLETGQYVATVCVLLLVKMGMNLRWSRVKPKLKGLPRVFVFFCSMCNTIIYI